MMDECIPTAAHYHINTEAYFHRSLIRLSLHERKTSERTIF